LGKVLSMAMHRSVQTSAFRSTPRVMARVFSFKFHHHQVRRIHLYASSIQSVVSCPKSQRQHLTNYTLQPPSSFERTSFTLDDLYRHLSPTDDDLEKRGKKCILLPSTSASTEPNLSRTPGVFASAKLHLSPRTPGPRGKDALTS